MEIKSVSLGARLITERTKAENLTKLILEMCKEWKIKREQVKGIITDYGSNIVAAAKAAFGEDKHYFCFAHGLNIAVTNAIGLYKKKKTEESGLPEDMDEDEEMAEFEREEEADATVRLL